MSALVGGELGPVPVQPQTCAPGRRWTFDQQGRPKQTAARPGHCFPCQGRHILCISSTSGASTPLDSSSFATRAPLCLLKSAGRSTTGIQAITQASLV